MHQETISIADFRNTVTKLSDVFLPRCFKRAENLEYQSSTTASVVYAGQNVAFVFTLDIRDQSIDLNVVRCCNGVLVKNIDGGYSSDIYSHLVTYCGFRARAKTPLVSIERSKAQQQVYAILSLLGEPCASVLLSDREDSLPC